MNTRFILILSDRKVSIRDWVEAFNQRDLDAASTDSPTLAQHYWRGGPPLLTVVDLSLPLDEVLQICRALHAINASASILLILPVTPGDDILSVCHAGVTECLIQPGSPAVILLKALAWSMRAGWEWPVSAMVSSLAMSEMMQ